MSKKPTRLKKPVKKRYKINKVLYKRIKKNVAQINSLIPNLKVLKQCKFLFLLLTATLISVLSQPKPNRMQYITQVREKECKYIYCLLQQIQKHS
jgi:hypothetical protein